MKKVTAIITTCMLIISTILVSFNMQVTATEAEFYYVPNDPLYNVVEPYFNALGVQQAWDITKGENVVVAVVDSGVALHPDLVDNLLPGYSAISSLLPNTDSKGHGTGVAGVIGAVRR